MGPSILLGAVVLCGLAAWTQAGPLMAVDLGGEFLKVAVVKPGRNPISVVPNEMSKRRTSAQVAFVDGDRLLGEEAAALAARYPDRVYTRCVPAPLLTDGLAGSTQMCSACCNAQAYTPQCRQDFSSKRTDGPVNRLSSLQEGSVLHMGRTRDLLGKPAQHSSVQDLLQNSKLPYAVTEDPSRRTVALKVHTGEEYTAEELVVCVCAAEAACPYTSLEAGLYVEQLTQH